MAVLNLRGVDKELAARLKSEAALAGISLRDYCVSIFKGRDTRIITLPKDGVSQECTAQKIPKELRRLKRERKASKMDRMDKLVELVRDEHTVRPYPENSIEEDVAKKIPNTRPPSTYKKVCAPENPIETDAVGTQVCKVTVSKTMSCAPENPKGN